jgi:hypothetical protein
MMIWLKKQSVYNEGELMLTFDPPAEDENEDDWILLTSREKHFEEIASELDKQAKIYEKQEDYRAGMVAKNLAKELRHRIHSNTLVN